MTSSRTMMVLLFLACSALFATTAGAQAGPRKRCARAFENAQEMARDGELMEAQAAFEGCTQRRCGRRLVRECRRQLTEIRRDLPTVVLAFRSTGGDPVGSVRVTMDGEPLVDRLDRRPVTVNPGFHTFAFELADGRRFQRMQTVRRGEKELPIVVEEQEKPEEPVVGTSAAALDAIPPSPADAPFELPPSRAPSVAPYIVGGVSLVAGVGAFVALRLLANAKYEALPACYPGCSQAQIDEVRAFYTASNISLVAAGAGTAVAAVMWWLDRDDERMPSDDVPRPFIVPTADGAMAGVDAKF